MWKFEKLSLLNDTSGYWRFDQLSHDFMSIELFLEQGIYTPLKVLTIFSLIFALLGYWYSCEIFSFYHFGCFAKQSSNDTFIHYFCPKYSDSFHRHPWDPDMDLSTHKLGQVHWFKQGFQSEIKNRTANSVDPDEMAHYEPSHLDLHCLHRYLFRSTSWKG